MLVRSVVLEELKCTYVRTCTRTERIVLHILDQFMHSCVEACAVVALFVCLSNLGAAVDRQLDSINRSSVKTLSQVLSRNTRQLFLYSISLLLSAKREIMNILCKKSL